MNHSPRLALCTVPITQKTGMEEENISRYTADFPVRAADSPQSDACCHIERQTDRQTNARLRTDKLRNVTASQFSN